MLPTEVVLADRFRLESRIAVGGMGEVWRAVDLRARLPVAVKVLSAEHAWPPQTLARFRAEAKRASSVSHRGMARIYYYDDGDPPVPPYLVMELVEEPSLARVLADGPLAPERTMEVIGQAAEALDAAHQAGVLHGDLKPSNILFGRGGQVKIIDFGIAEAAGSAPLTRTGSLRGSPAYLAPERAAGAAATVASDLYSLGVVAYECLAGAPPFPGSPREIVAAHRLGPLPPLPGDVPARVAVLVTRLTAMDPSARPANADQVSWWAFQLRDSLIGERGSQSRSRPAGPPSPCDPDSTGPIYPAGTAHANLTGTSFPALPGAMGPPTLAGVGPVLPVQRRANGPRPATYRRPGRPVARYGQTRWHRPRASRKTALAAAATAAVILLAIFAVGIFRSAPLTTAGGSATHATLPLVQVHSGALVGRPARTVVRLLRKLGLKPHVVRVVSSTQGAGRVVSVRPGGRVAVGSTVKVTVAVRPAPPPPSPPASPGSGGGGGGDD